MEQWLEQRGESVNLTQPMSAVDLSCPRAHSYQFDSSTLKPEFTFTKLLQALCGYKM